PGGARGRPASSCAPRAAAARRGRHPERWSPGHLHSCRRYAGGMRRGRIDLVKLIEGLAEKCPKCGASIPPAKMVRLSFGVSRCPECGQTYGEGVEADKAGGFGDGGSTASGVRRQLGHAEDVVEDIGFL